MENYIDGIEQVLHTYMGEMSSQLSNHYSLWFTMAILQAAVLANDRSVSINQSLTSSIVSTHNIS